MHVMYAFPTPKKDGLFDNLHSQQKTHFSKALVGKKINCVSALWNTTDWPLQSVFISLVQAMPFDRSLNETLLLSPCLNLISDSFLTKLCFSLLLPLLRCHCPHNELCQWKEKECQMALFSSVSHNLLDMWLKIMPLCSTGIPEEQEIGSEWAVKKNFMFSVSRRDIAKSHKGMNT